MDPGEPTLSAMAARLISMAVARHGVAPSDLCARVGIAPEALADVDGRVGVRPMIALWAEAERIVGDPHFGLHLGESAANAGPALPWYLVVASRTLGEGVARIVALWRLFNDVHPPELDVTDATATLRMRTKATPWPAPRHATEFAFAWFAGSARRATGTPISPLAVTFEHPKLSPWSTPSCVSCELRRRTRVPSSWSEPKNPRVQGRAVRRVRSRVYFTVAVKLSM